MTSLYNIGYELLHKIEEIQTLIDNGADPGSKEVQDLLNEMVGTETDLKDKAINVAHYIRHLDAQESLIKDEIKRLQDKAKSLSKRSSYLKDTLIVQMQQFGIDKIDGPILSIKLQANPWSVLVLNEDSVSGEYKRERVIIELDKKKLLLDRPEIDGVDYVQTKRLVFK